MLKLNYTDLGLYMEEVVISLEQLLTQRVILALRLSQNLHVEPGHASFLLPVALPELGQLKIVLQQEGSEKASLSPVDDEFVEISLRGSWVAESRDATEGIFLAGLSDRAEALIYKLWRISVAQVSSLA